MKNNDILDYSGSLINFGGKLETYLRIISSILKHYKNTDKELEKALLQSDYKQARTILHALKGILGNVGANNLLNHVIQAQDSIHNGKALSINQINSFKKSYNQTFAEIERLLEKHNDMSINNMDYHLNEENKGLLHSNKLPTILVVDDVVTNLVFVQHILQCSYHVKLANSGKEAFQIIADIKPDLILLDIIMPEMDGYTVCHKLKQDENTCEIPVIFFTSKDEYFEEAYGLLLGAVDYIIKPINPDVLLARVKTHISLKKAYEKLRLYKSKLEVTVQEAIEKVQQKDKQLITQSRLAAVGEMIDAIAHQWKQPLNKLYMNQQMLSFDYEQNKLNQDYIDSFQEKNLAYIDFMKTTINEFREFFNINQEQRLFDLHDTLNKVMILLEDDLLVNKIDCEIRHHNDSKLVINGKENEIEHLFINLIHNSRDAFNQKQIDNRQIIIETKLENNIIQIIVRDNAGGIEQSLLSSVFKPNVTSNNQDSGRGIGLYICQQIALKHNCHISVENFEKGAKFILVFSIKENS